MVVVGPSGGRLPGPGLHSRRVRTCGDEGGRVGVIRCPRKGRILTRDLVSRRSQSIRLVKFPQNVFGLVLGVDSSQFYSSEGPRRGPLRLSHPIKLV